MDQTKDQIRNLEDSLKYAKTNYDKSQIYNNLGVIWAKLSNNTKSLEYHKEELKFSKGNNSQTILAYRFIAEAYRRLKRYNKSIAYNNKHIKLAQNQNIKLEIQRGFCNLGSTYLDKSELFELDKEEKFILNINLALENFNKSFELAEELINDQKRDVDKDKKNGEIEKVKILNNLEKLKNQAQLNIGSTYFVKGKQENKYLEDAIKYFKHCEEHSKAINDQLILDKVYHGLGLVYMNKKDYAKSEEYLRKNEEICTRNNDYLSAITTLKSLARLYQLKRDYKASQREYNKALKLCDEYNFDTSVKDTIKEDNQNLNEEVKIDKLCLQLKCDFKIHENKPLSMVYIDISNKLIDNLFIGLEDHESVVCYINKIINKIVKEGANLKDNKKRDQFLSKFYHHLGLSYEALKNFKDGKQNFEESLILIDPSHPDYIPVLIDYANFKESAGESSEEIATIYWKAYKTSKSSIPQKIICLNNLDYLYKKTKNKQKSEEVKKMHKILDPDKSSSSSANESSDSAIGLSEEDDIVYESWINEEPCMNSKSINSIRKQADRMQNSDDELTEIPMRRLKKQKFSSILPNEASFERNLSNNLEISNENSRTFSFNNSLNNKTSNASYNHKNLEDMYQRLLEKYHLNMDKSIFEQLLTPKYEFKNKILNDLQVRLIMKLLKYNNNIKEINIKNNRASSLALRSLAKAINNCDNESSSLKNIEKLNLASNPLNITSHIEKSGNLSIFTTLITSLSKLTSLTYLNLSWTYFNKLDQEILFENIDNCSNLQILKLKGCMITDIYPQYTNNIMLIKVNLMDNMLTILSIESLLYGIKFKNLKILDISRQNYHVMPSLDQSFNEEINLKESHLESLNISFNDLKLLNSIWEKKSSHVIIQNLISLDTSGCENIASMLSSFTNTFLAYQMAGQGELKLTTLKMMKMNLESDEDTSIITLITLSKFLKKLDMSWTNTNRKYYDGIIGNIVKFKPHLIKLKMLDWKLEQSNIDELKIKFYGNTFFYS